MRLARAQAPAGYPADYADIVASARQEGKVVVYGVTSSVPHWSRVFPPVSSRAGIKARVAAALTRSSRCC